jgi:hypothetical protein
MSRAMILPKVRDPRFVTVRRGGTLQDDDHRLFAVWAADCAQDVLHHFERARPGDDRPRRAIGMGRAWARAEITWTQARRGSLCRERRSQRRNRRRAGGRACHRSVRRDGARGGPRAGGGGLRDQGGVGGVFRRRA